MGYHGMRAGGHLYGLADTLDWTRDSAEWSGYILDDPESIRYLQLGREDALAAEAKKGSGIADPVDVPSSW
jgi:hypothetical protein